jgi:hypothetical protein
MRMKINSVFQCWMRWNPSLGVFEAIKKMFEPNKQPDRSILPFISWCNIERTIFRSWASLTSLNVNKVKSHKTKTNLGRVEALVSPTDWTHPKRASKCLLQTFFLSLSSEEKKYKHFFFSDKKGRKKSSTQKQPICRLKRFLGEIYVWIASILFCLTRYLFSSCLSQLLFGFVVVRIESN